jgi:CMP-N,N'-diacetyllegionaminic acid synthase
MRKILAIIPARGGSKGIEKKNITLLAGEPLIKFTIDQAKQSKEISRIVVSTDDTEIANIAIKYGADVPYLRSPDLSNDETPSSDVVFDAIERVPGYETIVMLQPTSPLRLYSDIDAALKVHSENDFNSVVSVRPTNDSPYWTFKENGNVITALFPDELNKGRQLLQSTYVLNGAIYISSVSKFLLHRSFFTFPLMPYLMPAERSLDIDTQLELEEANRILLRDKRF